MMHRLKKLLGMSAAPHTAQVSEQMHAPSSAPAICAVGDLHGRQDLLELMLAQIAIRTQDAEGTPCVIIVGDMIDRGPDSAGTLRRLHQLNTQDPDTFICLMGNHERMMLDFLDDPLRNGARWIAAGGAETLTSFGLSPWGRMAMPELAKHLSVALTPALEDWVRALPLYWQRGSIAATHAGAAPEHRIDAQPAGRLLWGARGHAKTPRQDGICVIQGHDIVARAGLQNGCIMIDTGAWQSGRLSAAWLDKAGLSIIEVAVST